MLVFEIGLHCVRFMYEIRGILHDVICGGETKNDKF